MLGATARGLDRLSSGLNTVALIGAVLAVLVMVYAAGWQVIARYIFSSPPIWTEELARRAMVWAGMLGASAAFHAGADPNLFPQMQAIRGRMGAALTLIRASGVILFAAPIIWFSLFGPNMNMARGFIGRTLGREAEMIPISMAWFTSAVPLAFVLILIHLLARVSMAATGQLTSPPEKEPT
jgi:TRAP-type transport system small permease protein